MSKSFSDDIVVNASINEHLADVVRVALSRRALLKAAGAAGLLSVLPLGGCAGTAAERTSLGFTGIGLSTDDTIRVPPGYSATTFYRWGDPIGHRSGSPPFSSDARNSADEQALQAGMHHDGIEYFPLPYGSKSSTRGLLAMNHEYTDDGLLHPNGFAN
jgi:secreted PhoX family phosphatase